MNSFKSYVAPLLFTATIFLSGVIFAEIFSLYNRFPNIDILFHICGGMAIAWLSIVALNDYKSYINAHFKNTPLGRLGFFIIILGIVTLIGVLWEFAEYASSIYARNDLPLLYHYFHGGDLADTIKDIADDIIGAVIACLIGLWIYNKKTKNTF